MMMMEMDYRLAQNAGNWPLPRRHYTGAL